METANLESAFITKLRNNFFPIYAGEFRKFILLASICFFVCMNFTMLRNVKDTLVITNPDIGINAVPFIRTWLLMPLMLIFMKTYAGLSSRFTQDKVCYLMLSIFLFYFTLFLTVLYPNESSLRLNGVANWISNLFPLLKPLGDIFKYWSFSIYYCLAEIWGIVVVLILFWGTSNRSNTLDEAKRFYSPIILITNLSGILSSQISLTFSQGDFKYYLFPNMSKWDATLSSLTLCICFVTFLIMSLFFILNKYVLNNPVSLKIPPKEEMSLLKIIQFIGKNPKFRPLVIMVFSYFFCTGVMELVWKYYLHKLYPDANDFNDFLNLTTIYIGIGSTLVALLITGNIIRHFSWRVSAMVTPILLLIPLMTLVLNYFFNFDKAEFLKITVLLTAFYYGLNRICKFTFFDLSKEIATVEFNYEEQIKAKTVLDGLVPNIARTGEAVFLQFVLMTFAFLDNVILFLLMLLLTIHVLWAYNIPIKKKSIILNNELAANK